MVIKFKSNTISPPAYLYMGVDKYENEKLIQWGWPEDVWFHVDKLSSAHVYLRLPSGMTINTIPEALIDDCCQLVKANSIEGNKMSGIDVVYTMWSNLKKTGDMAVGQIGFHRQSEVKKTRVEKRINEIVNRLEKTKTVEEIDYQAEREARDAEERQKQRQLDKVRRTREEAEAAERERLRRQRNYEDVDDSKATVTCNKEVDGNLSDDFM